MNRDEPCTVILVDRDGTTMTIVVRHSDGGYYSTTEHTAEVSPRHGTVYVFPLSNLRQVVILTGETAEAAAATAKRAANVADPGGTAYLKNLGAA